jgi:hypothetical protein
MFRTRPVEHLADMAVVPRSRAARYGPPGPSSDRSARGVQPSRDNGPRVRPPSVHPSSCRPIRLGGVSSRAARQPARAPAGGCPAPLGGRTRTDAGQLDSSCRRPAVQHLQQRQEVPDRRGHSMEQDELRHLSCRAIRRLTGVDRVAVDPGPVTEQPASSLPTHTLAWRRVSSRRNPCHPAAGPRAGRLHRAPTDTPTTAPMTTSDT